VVAAFKPALQPLAFIAGFVSVVSFIWMAWHAVANRSTARANR
jgi:hypothetical protein